MRCRRRTRPEAVETVATAIVVAGNGMPSCTARAAPVPGAHEPPAAAARGRGPSTPRGRRRVPFHRSAERQPTITIILHYSSDYSVTLLRLGQKMSPAETNSCDISRPRTRARCARNGRGRTYVSPWTDPKTPDAEFRRNFHITSPPSTREPCASIRAVNPLAASSSYFFFFSGAQCPRHNEIHVVITVFVTV